MLSGRLFSYLKKRKISRNGHSLSLVATRCHSLYHSLSLVVTRCHSLSLLVVIRRHSLYHSFSLVVTRCTTRRSFYKRSSLSIYLFIFSFNTKLVTFCLLKTSVPRKFDWQAQEKQNHNKARCSCAKLFWKDWALLFIIFSSNNLDTNNISDQYTYFLSFFLIRKMTVKSW